MHIFITFLAIQNLFIYFKQEDKKNILLTKIEQKMRGEIGEFV